MMQPARSSRATVPAPRTWPPWSARVPSPQQDSQGPEPTAEPGELCTHRTFHRPAPTHPSPWSQSPEGPEPHCGRCWGGTHRVPSRVKASHVGSPHWPVLAMWGAVGLKDSCAPKRPVLPRCPGPAPHAHRQEADKLQGIEEACSPSCPGPTPPHPSPPCPPCTQVWEVLSSFHLQLGFPCLGFSAISFCTVFLHSLPTPQSLSPSFAGSLTHHRRDAGPGVCPQLACRHLFTCSMRLRLGGTGGRGKLYQSAGVSQGDSPGGQGTLAARGEGKHTGLGDGDGHRGRSGRTGSLRWGSLRGLSPWRPALELRNQLEPETVLGRAAVRNHGPRQ